MALNSDLLKGHGQASPRRAYNLSQVGGSQRLEFQKCEDTSYLSTIPKVFKNEPWINGQNFKQSLGFKFI